MTGYRGRNLYNQYEEAILEQSKMSKQIQDLSITIYNLNYTINTLNKQIENLTEMNKKLIEENEKLKNKINKNSGNSSNPPSSDKPSRSGQNLYNSRVKSNKKVGGQEGHKGHNLDKLKLENKIKDNNIKTIDIIHYVDKNKYNKEVVKYKIGLKVETYVEKHIFIPKEDCKDIIPKEYYTDVTYTNDFKALAIELSVHNVISYNRLTEFFSTISNGMINVSQGTLVNIVKEFSIKSKSTLLNIRENLLLSKIMHTDETYILLNGKSMYIRNYSNPLNVLYIAHLKKGHEPIKEDDILPIFNGGIMGDHDTTLYSYGIHNYECNVHLGRYLRELIENIPEITWAKKLLEYLLKIKKKKEEEISNDNNNFQQAEIDEIFGTFDSIINIGKSELKLIKSAFYKEKTKTLINRLEKYKTNHLYFILDFEVPYDNNMSERDLRTYKIKNNISGCFRSFDASTYYSNTMSIIKTGIKRGMNSLECIKRIFNNEVLFN